MGRIYREILALVGNEVLVDRMRLQRRGQDSRLSVRTRTELSVWTELIGEATACILLSLVSTTRDGELFISLSCDGPATSLSCLDPSERTISFV
jgi:hypothetical protein